MTQEDYQPDTVLEEAQEVEQCELYEMQNNLSPNEYDITTIKIELKNIILDEESHDNGNIKKYNLS